MPDEALMRHLERKREWGHDDYPIGAMWNSILAGVVCQHPSIESLRRAVPQRPVKRTCVGLKVIRCPPSWAYSRFLTNLFSIRSWLTRFLKTWWSKCFRLLPGFGRNLALDRKPLDSHARRKKAGLAPDGRRDLDADVRAKIYRGSVQTVLLGKR